ncbi:MAG: hypothetical protein CVT61_00235 [Actinobacteria bacterium HGW-Actinobacteria-11]|nr:MAG: hypothetical protein CVT61_00235 [Actinobacteria bacterium HGW-Actinobacteria-11]
MSVVNLTAIRTFKSRCEMIGIEPPAAIDRGLHVLAVAESTVGDPEADLLTLSDDQVRGLTEALAIRRHESGSKRGMKPGVRQIEHLLAGQIRTACLPDLERITGELRPKFDEAAALLHTAARHGITYATTAAEILDRNDAAATAAYRDVGSAVVTLDTIAALRISMSEMFDLSPTRDDVERVLFPRVLQAGGVNHSVCFAEGDNWSLFGGFYIEKNARGKLDWLKIAEGGLRLNTPAEVLEKLRTRGVEIRDRDLDAAKANGDADWEHEPDEPSPSYPVVSRG